MLKQPALGRDWGTHVFEEAGFVEGRLLRIYVGEDAHDGRSRLYDAIVRLARDEGCSGASVFRGIEGFGGHGEIRLNRVFALHNRLPILIEIVESPEKIAALLPKVEPMIDEGIVTVERVSYRRYLPKDRTR